MSNHSRKFRLSFGLITVGLIILYGLFQARHLLEGPIVVITEPQNGATLSDDLVTVRGHARNIAYIRLNDRQIFVDGKGYFEEKLIAPVGYSIIKVWAEDKFGTIEEQFIHVFLPSSSLPAPSAIEPQSTTTSPISEAEIEESQGVNP